MLVRIVVTTCEKSAPIILNQCCCPLYLFIHYGEIVKYVIPHLWVPIRLPVPWLKANMCHGGTIHQGMHSHSKMHQGLVERLGAPCLPKLITKKPTERLACMFAPLAAVTIAHSVPV